MLQDGSRVLKLHGSGQARVGKDVLEHGVRQACASLLRQAVEKGVNPMLHRHGQAAEPGLQRLLDFTVFASASAPDSFEPRKLPASAMGPRALVTGCTKLVTSCHPCLRQHLLRHGTLCSSCLR